jgi:AraC family transcriptional regulator of adaptative response / DNA-3-methyladenine glycosylase II
VALTRRLHFAKRLIDETDFPMTQIAFASGFASLRRFNDAFQKAYDRPPSALRRLRHADAPPGRGEVALRLAFRPPGGFADVLAFLAARAIPGVERVDAGGYARTVALPSGPTAVTVDAVRGRNELRLHVVGAPATALLPLTTRVRRVFDLASDPATIGAALRRDPLLAPLVRRRPGLRIPGAWDAFECAVRAVVGQQVSVAAGRTLVTRIVERAGRTLDRPMDGLARLFPSPAELAAADLTGLGLVPARARTVAALARAVAEGRLVLDGPADAVRAALLALPGVGEWTAEYVALRALGEPDAFPAGDLVLRRAAGEGRSLTARALAARAEAWRPWRGYAAVHLWEAAASRPRASRGAQGE